MSISYKRLGSIHGEDDSIQSLYSPQKDYEAAVRSVTVCNTSGFDDKYSILLTDSLPYVESTMNILTGEGLWTSNRYNSGTYELLQLGGGRAYGDFTIPSGSSSTKTLTMTTLSNLNGNDALILIRLPFATYYDGKPYNELYLSANSYITFGGSETQSQPFSTGTWAFDVATPYNPKILLGSEDRAQGFAYFDWDDTFWQITFIDTTNNFGGPHKWQIRSYASTPYQLEINMVNYSANTGFTTGHTYACGIFKKNEMIYRLPEGDGWLAVYTSQRYDVPESAYLVKDDILQAGQTAVLKGLYNLNENQSLYASSLLGVSSFNAFGAEYYKGGNA